MGQIFKLLLVAIPYGFLGFIWLGHFGVWGWTIWQHVSVGIGLLFLALFCLRVLYLFRGTTEEQLILEDKFWWWIIPARDLFPCAVVVSASFYFLLRAFDVIGPVWLGHAFLMGLLYIAFCLYWICFGKVRNF